MVNIEERINLILQTKDRTLLENLLYEYDGDNFNMDQIGDILMTICDDKEYIKSFVANPNYGLTTFQKESIIARLGDDAFRNSCIRGEVEGVDLEPFSKARLYMMEDFENTEQRDEHIHGGLSGRLFDLDSFASEYLIDELSEPEDKKPYILSESIPLEVSERIALANKLNEDDFTRQVVGTLDLTGDYDKKNQVIEAVSTVRSADIRKDFIRNNHRDLFYIDLYNLAQGSANHDTEEISDICEWGVENGIELRKIDDMVNAAAYRNEQNRTNWNAGVKRVSTISELNLNDLAQNPDIKYIRMTDPDNPSARNDLYTREKYEQIIEAAEKILDGIPMATPGDAKSELEVFSQVFSRVSKIRYNNYAVSKRGEKDEDLQVTCRSMEDAFLKGECVCSGYATALKNLLSLRNIKAVEIGGAPEKEGKAGHSWNQVQIGGVWLNCDPTNTREYGRFNGKFAYKALKTDKQFKEWSKYTKGRSKEEKECTVPIEEVINKKQNPIKAYVKSWASKLSLRHVNDASREVSAMEQEKILIAQEQSVQMAAVQKSEQQIEDMDM